MIRRSIIGVVAALLATTAAQAQVGPSTPEDGLRRVQIQLHRGRATLRTEHPLPGTPGEPLSLNHLALADGGVVTGMRAHDGSSWMGGVAIEASQASEHFLGRPGLNSERGASRALVEWRSQGAVSVQFFSNLTAPRRVELTTTVMTSYEGGRERFDLSSLLGEQAGVELELSGEPGAALFVNGLAVRGGARLTSQAGPTVVAMEPDQKPPLMTQLATAAVNDQELLRLRLLAAPRVSTVPRGAGVVVLIDASRSMSAAQRKAATQIARRYLAHFPDVRAGVVFFDRHVHAPLPGLTTAARAQAALATAVPPANGSRVDLALDRAGALLHGHAGARRVLVLTDGLAPSALTNAALQRVTERIGALVHIGIIPPGGASAISRDDDHEWAPAARVTGGLVWTTGLDPEPQHDHGVEALVRPLSIDHLQIHAAQHDETYKGAGWPDSLDEGAGFELVQAAKPPGSFEVKGELWASPVNLVARASADENVAWATQVIGTSLFSALSEPEQRVLAARTSALTPFTSLLAYGDGPHNDLRGNLWGSSSGSHSNMHGTGGTGFGQGRGGRGRRLSIRDAVENAWLRCTGGQGSADVTVEVTRSEVVDVPSVAVTDGPPGAQPCLQESLWRMEFPANTISFSEHHIVLPG